MAKKKKEKPAKIDGLSDGDLKKIRSAIREIWNWSTPRKICLARAIGKDGFPRCEKCKKKVPKVYADHITPAGQVDNGFIARMFTPSINLQALCHECHRKKTNQERAMKREIKVKDFF